MAVKHSPTKVIHGGKKGGKTNCGVDTTQHPDHWVTTSEKITCKNCKK